MKDKRDMSERLKYFQELKIKIGGRKIFYNEQIEIVKILLRENKEEIEYNEGWNEFHKKAITEHKNKIELTIDFKIKKDQEEKIKWHSQQIEKHHNKYIEFHQREISALLKEIELFEKGLKRCNEQIKIIEEKIKENLSS